MRALNKDMYLPSRFTTTKPTPNTRGGHFSFTSDRLMLPSERLYHLDKDISKDFSQTSVLRHRSKTLTLLEGTDIPIHGSDPQSRFSILTSGHQSSFKVDEISQPDNLEFSTGIPPMRNHVLNDRPPTVGYIALKNNIRLSQAGVSHHSVTAAEYYRIKGQAQAKTSVTTRHPCSDLGWGDMRLKTPDFPPDNIDRVKAHYSWVESEIFESEYLAEPEPLVHPGPPANFLVKVTPPTPWILPSAAYLSPPDTHPGFQSVSATSFVSPDLNKKLPPHPSLYVLQMDDEDEESMNFRCGTRYSGYNMRETRPPSLAEPKRERFKKHMKSSGKKLCAIMNKERPFWDFSPVQD